MSFDTDFDTAFTILLGKAVAAITPTGTVPVTTGTSGTSTTTSAPTTRVVDVPLVIGGRGVSLSTNDHVFYRLGLNGTVTIITWSLAGTASGVAFNGTISVDLLVGSTLASVASICGSHRPSLNGQSERSDQTPDSDWTTTIADPRWIMAKVLSNSGIEVISLTLRCSVPA
jgi:hypothetical protein